MTGYWKLVGRLLLWCIPSNAALVLLPLILPVGALQNIAHLASALFNLPATMWLLGPGEWLLKRPGVNWFLLAPLLSVPNSILWALLLGLAIVGMNKLRRPNQASEGMPRKLGNPQG